MYRGTDYRDDDSGLNVVYGPPSTKYTVTYLALQTYLDV